MAKIRVLVADDSLVVRRVVTEELAAQPDIEVVGAAINGKIAVEKLVQLNPDLVILDIEMPEMDGLTALSHMRRSHPRTPIVMFSSLTAEGAAATLEALARGATDFFAKPGGIGGLEASRKVIRDELAPAIRALCPRALARLAEGATSAQPIRGVGTSPRAPTPLAGFPSSSVSTLPAGSPPPPASLTHSRMAPPSATAGVVAGRPAGSLAATNPLRVDLLAIGASTGGPNALAELFAGLPREFPVPIVVVQHMPPMFTQMLAERLTRNSPIPTDEAKPGMTIEPGRAYVAPGDFHLTLGREGVRVVTKLDQGAHENACRPAVDPLLRSVASIYGRNSLAVVLTGMGQDGLRGCEAIRSALGQVLVQDEATSVVWGMPGYVARAGLADRILPLQMLAGEITRRARHGRG